MTAIRRKPRRWYTREYFSFVELPDASGKVHEYRVDLAWGTAWEEQHRGKSLPNRNHLQWQYDILDGDARGGRNTIAEGSTGTNDDMKAKAVVLRVLKALHKKKCETCTDCNGYLPPGVGCPRCAEQFEEEIERAKQNAETEGLAT